MVEHDSAPDAAQFERFEQGVHAWVAGQLSASDAQWMAQMVAHHPELQAQVEVLRAVQRTVQTAVAREDTQDAWALLQRKLMAEPQTAAVPEPQPPRRSSVPVWQRWQQVWQAWWTQPRWTNAMASVALAVVVVQTGWLVWRDAPPAAPAAPETTWRALEVDALAPAASAVVMLAVQWRAGASAADIAAVQADAAHDPQARVLWQPLGAQQWQLQVHGSVRDSAWWRQYLQAQPQVLAVHDVQAVAMPPSAGGLR